MGRSCLDSSLSCRRNIGFEDTIGSVWGLLFVHKGPTQTQHKAFSGSDDPESVEDRSVGGTQTWINNIEIESPILRAAESAWLYFWMLGLLLASGQWVHQLVIFVCPMVAAFAGILQWVLFVLNMESQFSEDPEKRVCF